MKALLQLKKMIPYGIIGGIATKVMYSEPVTYVTAPGEKGVGLQLTPLAWAMMIVVTVIIALYLKNETNVFKTIDEGRVKKVAEPTETPEWLKEAFEREEI